VGHARGFTLIELMVTCAIVGAALLIVPVSFDTFGARGRLADSTNDMLSEITATREQAVLDGYEARWEVGRFLDEEGERRWGTRFWFTNVPAKGTEGTEEDRDAARERATSRAEERQWLNSTWHPLPQGVIVSGISLEAGQWEKLGEGDKTFQVRFFADGAVERGFGVRLESQDLEVRLEDRTVTLLINPLTSEPASYEGLLELTKQRDASDFK